MNISKMDKEHLLKEVYGMDGIGLADYLRDWTTGELNLDSRLLDGFNGDLFIKSTQYGEKVFIEGDEFGMVDLFNDWIKWRTEVGYYFDGFIREQKRSDIEIFSTLDGLKEYFVWKIARIARLIDGLEAFFIVEPPITLDEDPLLFM